MGRVRSVGRVGRQGLGVALPVASCIPMWKPKQGEEGQQRCHGEIGGRAGGGEVTSRPVRVVPLSRGRRGGEPEESWREDGSFLSKRPKRRRSPADGLERLIADSHTLAGMALGFCFGKGMDGWDWARNQEETGKSSVCFML